MSSSEVTRKVTVIGGGSGSYQVLTGLKEHVELDIRSIVSMTDSGGDSGNYRDDFGVLPPGDMRRCLVALSEETELMRQLFQYRFDEAWLSGRSVGNLLMFALTRVLGDQKAAIEAVSTILKIRGEVVPVTWQAAHLCAVLADGHELVGECAIDRRPPSCRQPIASVRLEPRVDANPRALEVIADADFLVLAPGDLYTSLIANLLVGGISEAICRSNAQLIYIQNLMTKPGETDGYTASHHVDEIRRYAGRIPDVVLAHQGGMPDHLRSRYEAERACQVAIDTDALYALGVGEVMRAPLMSGQSFARHDPVAVAAAMMELITSEDRGALALHGVGR